MATASHQPSVARTESRGWSRRARVPEMWAALGIVAMWLAVLFAAVFAPDFVSSSATDTTRIPSVFVVALFAYLGTRALAKAAFGRSRGDTD